MTFANPKTQKVIPFAPRPDWAHRIAILGFNPTLVILERFLIVYHHLILKKNHPQNFHNSMRRK
jgi:hypothetical protein